MESAEKTNSQNTWTYRCSPFWVALICWLLAAVWIWLGVAVIPDFVIRSAFIVLASLTAVSCCFLKKVHLWIGVDRKVLLRTSGGWLSFRTATDCIPLDGVHLVVYRVYIVPWQKQGAFVGDERLLLRNADGKDRDIFPYNVQPFNPKKCGQSLAEFLQVEFKDETVQASLVNVYDSLHKN